MGNESCFWCPPLRAIPAPAGLAFLACSYVSLRRLIPASTGSAKWNPKVPFIPSDHPRVYGVCQTANIPIHSGCGPSPRLRGLPFVFTFIFLVLRLRRPAAPLHRSGARKISTPAASASRSTGSGALSAITAGVTATPMVRASAPALPAARSTSLPSAVMEASNRA